MLLLPLLLACVNPAESRPVHSATETAMSATPADTSGLSRVEGANGLAWYVLRPGTGAIAVPGDTVNVHYTGWLSTGAKFDSSHDRGKPLSFALGAGRVIKGWDSGVAGMKVGEHRQLRIPAALGYGARGAGGVIPPDADLVFDVELVSIHGR